MSTDYQIFFQSDEPVESTLELISRVEGVDTQGELHIEGLVATSFGELTTQSRQIMLDEYGEYGLNVNWNISGTYDKTTDICELTERLFRCAAVMVNAHPNRSLSLMRNAESFYVFNEPSRLIVSPVYSKSHAIVETLFQKPFNLELIEY